MTYKEQTAAFEAIKSLYCDEPRDKGTSFREVVNSLKNVVNANRRDIGESYLRQHYQYFVFDSKETALNCLRMYQRTWANINSDICADIFLHFKSRNKELCAKC